MEQQLNGGSVPQDFYQFQTWLKSLFTVDQTGNVIENPNALQYTGGSTNEEDRLIREKMYSFANIREAYYLQQMCKDIPTSENPNPSETIVHALADNCLLNAFIAWTVPLENRALASQSLMNIFQNNFQTAVKIGDTKFCKTPQNEIFVNNALNQEIINLKQQLLYEKSTIDSQAQLLVTAAEEQSVLKSAIEAMKREQNDATDSLVRTWQEKYNELQYATDAIVKEKNITLLQEIEQLKVILGTIQDRHGNELKMVNENYQNEIKKLTEQNDTILKDCKDKVNTTEMLKMKDIELIKQQSRSEIQDIKQQYEKDKDDIKKTLKDEFQSQYSDLKNRYNYMEESNKKYREDCKKLLNRITKLEQSNGEFAEGMDLRNQEITTQKAIYEDKLNQYLASNTSLQQQLNLITLQLTTKTTEFQTEIGRVRNEEKMDCANNLSQLKELNETQIRQSEMLLKLKHKMELEELNRTFKVQLEQQKTENSNNVNNCVIM